jgi:hypothetical protein
VNSQDDRLEEIRDRITNGTVGFTRNTKPPGPLPLRSKGLAERIEYVLNAWQLERMELVERGTRLPKDWSWCVMQHINAAVKPTTIPFCKRLEIRIKNRIRRIGEWLFRVAQ